MKVDTTALQNICIVLSGVIKEDKARPVTELVQIFEDGKFGMTDLTTRICAKIEFEGEPISGVIKMGSLLKLVKLTTKDTMTLELKDKHLEVKGNGKYKIPLETDQGNDINLNVSMPPDVSDKLVEINTDIIKTALVRNKLSLYTGEAHPEYNKYYSADGVTVTSDGFSVAIVIGELFEQELAPYVLEQLSTFAIGTAKYLSTDNGYYFEYGDVSMYTRKFSDLPFPADVVMPYVDFKENSEMFGDSIKLSKRDFMDAIKRIDLFKSKYSDPTFTLTITDKCVTLDSTQGKATEELEPLEAVVEKETSIVLSTEFTLRVIRSMEDTVTIYCGNDDALIIEDSIGSFILSRIEE